MLTIRDMVRAQAQLADHLGIDCWHAVVGGSMGGMQVLEWAIMYPHRVRSMIPIATCMQATAQQIAWGAIGRRAIALDPRWRGGEYYDAEDGPAEGLAIARMVAQVTFRSDNVFTDRFGRDLVDRAPATRSVCGSSSRSSATSSTTAPSSTVASTPTATWSSARPWTSTTSPAAAATSRRRWPGSRAASLAIGVSSDLLYPNYQQRQIDELLRSEGVWSRYVEIDSPHGHDAFLINLDQIGEPIAEFVDQVSER